MAGIFFAAQADTHKGPQKLILAYLSQLLKHVRK